MSKQIGTYVKSTSAKGDSNMTRAPRVSGSNFKMPSLVKTMLAREADPVARNLLKRAMIEAITSAEKQSLEMAKKKEK